MEMVYSSEFLIPLSLAIQHHTQKGVTGFLIAVKQKSDLANDADDSH
jgi:hypothetical protein